MLFLTANPPEELIGNGSQRQVKAVGLASTLTARPRGFNFFAEPVVAGGVIRESTVGNGRHLGRGLGSESTTDLGSAFLVL